MLKCLQFTQDFLAPTHNILACKPLRLKLDNEFCEDLLQDDPSILFEESSLMTFLKTAFKLFIYSGYLMLALFLIVKIHDYLGYLIRRNQKFQNRKTEAYRIH